MSLTIEEVEKISKLARLNFSDEEKQKLTSELTGILNYVDQIKSIAQKSDATHKEDPDAINLMRDDVAEPTADPKLFLEQAPAKEGDFLKVKSILD